MTDNLVRGNFQKQYKFTVDFNIVFENPNPLLSSDRKDPWDNLSASLRTVKSVPWESALRVQNGPWVKLSSFTLVYEPLNISLNIWTHLGYALASTFGDKPFQGFKKADARHVLKVSKTIP